MSCRPVRSRALAWMMLAGALALAAPPIAAQGYGGGGMHRWNGGGRGGGGGGGGGAQAMDPVVLKGPPSPDSMAALVGLDTASTERYATLYQNLMTATKPQRDSLATLRQSWRGRAGNGDGVDSTLAGGGGGGGGGSWGGGEGRRGGGGMMRGPANDLRQYLADQQKRFDDALGDILTKDQMKTYRDWRDQQRKQARDRMRQMRGEQGSSSDG